MLCSGGLWWYRRAGAKRSQRGGARATPLYSSNAARSCTRRTRREPVAADDDDSSKQQQQQSWPPPDRNPTARAYGTVEEKLEKIGSSFFFSTILDFPLICVSLPHSPLTVSLFLAGRDFSENEYCSVHRRRHNIVAQYRLLTRVQLFVVVRRVKSVRAFALRSDLLSAHARSLHRIYGLTARV